MSDESMVEFRRLLAEDGFTREQIDRIVILAQRSRWEMTKRLFRGSAGPGREK